MDGAQTPYVYVVEGLTFERALMTLKFAFISILIGGVLSGCNHLTNYKELEANERLAIVTDVKRNIGNGVYEEFKITCPEASPDALMMLAGSVSGESKAGVSLAAAFSQSGSNIGLRTHSIQLLRDQLFSICQAYANGGLTNFMYQTLLTRSQRNTIILMAIEQLTGVLNTPQVSITTTAEASAANLQKLTQELESERARLAAIQDQNSAAATAAKDNIKALEQGLASSRSSIAKASGAVPQPQQNTQQKTLSDESVRIVADRVKELALMVVDRGDSDNLNVCMSLLNDTSPSSANTSLGSSRDSQFNMKSLSISEANSLRGVCMNMVTAMVKNYTKRLDSEAVEVAKTAELIKNASTAEEVRKITTTPSTPLRID